MDGWKDRCSSIPVFQSSSLPVLRCGSTSLSLTWKVASLHPHQDNLKEADGSDPSWEAVPGPDVRLHGVPAVCGGPLAALLPPTPWNSTLERLTGESRQSLHHQPTFSFLTLAVHVHPRSHHHGSVFQFSIGSLIIPNQEMLENLITC